MSILVVALDLVGTFVFGLSGALVGVKHKADLFGILVLSFAAANAGGILRDLLIGAVPPAAISDWRYIVAALLPGLITFFAYRSVKRLNELVLVFDAAGLSLFAVSGALEALDFHLNPLAAIIMGILTGVGGGMTRDILVNEVPTVLRTDIYAVAALVGASVVVIGYTLGLPSVAGTILGGALCFVIRILAIKRRWKLPLARHSD